ncbi:hypothetical protein PF011_g23433 [Phytophthora fragariae]|uniref:Uncharacterized protein n=1 Tax=Phytophthora fragariae TaxID=53985 RepID=A0A6A3IDV9_9STRA|nr:hypothetical protein PF011_g23433 [Phytophthora fragariae]
MELSQLRFKVYRKPGAAMGHAGGLSRLHSDTICALTIADLLNEDPLSPEESSVPVGEDSSPGQNNGGTASSSSVTNEALREAVQAAMDALNEVGEPPDPLSPTNSEPDATDDAPGALADVGDCSGATHSANLTLVQHALSGYIKVGHIAVWSPFILGSSPIGQKAGSFYQ